MSKKNLNILSVFFLIVFLAGLSYSFYRHKKNVPDSAFQLGRERRALKEIFPQATEIRFSADPLPHYKVYRGSFLNKNNFLGIAYNTLAATPKIKGYNGPIEMMIGLSPQGTIVGLVILSHSETPHYTGNLNAFAKQFIGLSYNSRFELGEKIDAITGATITSRGFAKTVEESARLMVSSVLKLDVTGRQQRDALPVAGLVTMGVLFLIAIVGIFLKNQMLRWLSLSIGFFFLGVSSATMFSVIHVVNLGLLEPPSFGQNPLLLVLLIAVFLSLVVFGNLYCGNLCPFAALEELFSFIPKKFPKICIPASPRIDDKLRYAKYFVLFFSLAIGFAMANSGHLVFEPFVILFAKKITLLGKIYIACLLLFSLLNYRFWCKYLCPIGALNGLIGRLSIFKIRPQKLCKGCEICVRSCPVNALRKEKGEIFVNYAECILCGECLRSCPYGSLKYRKGHK